MIGEVYFNITIVILKRKRRVSKKSKIFLTGYLTTKIIKFFLIIQIAYPLNLEPFQVFYKISPIELQIEVNKHIK
jgi:hypothetical protein